MTSLSLDQIRRMSLNPKSCTASLPIGRIDFEKPFIPEHFTQLYYLPVYSTLPFRQKLRYNQLFGIKVCEQLMNFENVFLNRILKKVLRHPEICSRPSLFSCLSTFIQEEEKHYQLFKDLALACLPEVYSKSDFYFTRLSLKDGLFFKLGTAWPTRFHFVLWFVIALEEYSVALSQEMLRNPNTESLGGLEPHFLAVHGEHLKDEWRHVHLDVHLIESCLLSDSPTLRKINAWIFETIFNEILIPKRTGVAVLRRWFMEFPDIESKTIEREVQTLGHQEAYQNSLFSKKTMPLTFSLFEKHEEWRKRLHSSPQKSALPIPEKTNMAISVAAYSLAIFFLALASHAEAWPMKIIFALCFSFAANTVFSLMHESVHGVFHTHPKINELFGHLSAVFFPTSFSIQRACHGGHHRRNRSDQELFDYYFEGQNKWLKRYQLYSLLTGFYWLSVPVGCLLYLWIPQFPLKHEFRKKWIEPMGMDPMVGDVENLNPQTTRMEILFTISAQLGIFWICDLTWQGWLFCYAAFALNWCSLQYSVHAWSVRDIQNGAWNLTVSPAIRWIFLNYHLHLAHHQNTDISWIHLPRRIDPGFQRPSFIKQYLSLWMGPRPLNKTPDSFSS